MLMQQIGMWLSHSELFWESYNWALRIPDTPHKPGSCMVESGSYKPPIGCLCFLEVYSTCSPEQNLYQGLFCFGISIVCRATVTKTMGNHFFTFFSGLLTYTNGSCNLSTTLRPWGIARRTRPRDPSCRAPRSHRASAPATLRRYRNINRRIRVLLVRLHKRKLLKKNKIGI